MNTRAYAAAFLAGLSFGCTTFENLGGSGSDPVSIEITSVPTASKILVNGEDKGVTPLVLTLAAKKKWVGILVSPGTGGWEYENNFYFVEAVPPTDYKERLLSDSTYIDPRNAASTNKFHFELPQGPSSAGPQAGAIDRVLGVQESLLPTFKSTFYVQMLQINGQPLAKWGANAYVVQLPVGRYSIATRCKGVLGEVKVDNLAPLKIDVESGKTYQIETELADKRCRVYAKASDK